MEKGNRLLSPHTHTRQYCFGEEGEEGRNLEIKTVKLTRKTHLSSRKTRLKGS